ncbi:hypothetical protein Hypma_014353 [Hypsizygus marmoreus]|uniref:Uncharacterized protein n=1 Tax=Hypsizygus marmoreus TaxID=39966 RepID=A0A369JJT3_HYPMA|nr:hypothetical protein Hypma_014353 [Hypsizygus marmoreus]
MAAPPLLRSTLTVPGFEHGTGVVNVLRVSPDGEYLASGENTGVMKVSCAVSYSQPWNEWPFIDLRDGFPHLVKKLQIYLRNPMFSVASLHCGSESDDFFKAHNVKGLPKVLQFNGVGDLFAVAYGEEVVLMGTEVLEEDQWQTTILAIPRNSNVRGIHFLDQARVAISFLLGGIL